jgi:fructan beta-fructosidase
VVGTHPLRAANDNLFADFEGENYGGWAVEGAAFGSQPARGTLPGQMNVEGFAGGGLVNSFTGGDNSRGRLTSPTFVIERDWISFLIGGGGFDGKTCLNLLVDGKAVRTATGPNTQPGGSERLEPAAWDVRGLRGSSARIEIVDDATGGWGHINVDHMVFTDQKPRGTATKASRELTADRRWLHFPVKTGARKRTVTVGVGGRLERAFEIELADAVPDWWAPLDIAPWRGQVLTVTIDALPDGSRGLESIAQSDDLQSANPLYGEALRPGIHFSARRGWLNDPNGLVHHRGQFHLFFQHNPYGWNWGNMHWGHATSPDLVHWKEIGEALYPDELGTMFSGSAVVDHRNTSGLGRGTYPPIVLFYTAAGGTGAQSPGQRFSQCFAYSDDDGHTWKKFAGNPVVKEITPGNRDPKVLWHEPSQQWVMVLYVEKNKTHTIEFLTSPNLRDWSPRSETSGFYECPDFFELPVEGDAKQKRWVLTAASSEYMLGDFDGTSFTPVSTKLPGHRGKGFYAAQTFSDMPDGRRVQIGWLQAPSPGMPFNQCMSLPLELSLLATPDGPRLAWQPARELERLRAKSHGRGRFLLEPGGSNPAANARGEWLEVRAEFAATDAANLAIDVRGVKISYDSRTEEIVVNDHRAPAPMRGGRQRLIVYIDRTCIEVLASDGLTYVPLPVIPDAAKRGVEVSVEKGRIQFDSLAVHELRSIWPAP